MRWKEINLSSSAGAETNQSTSPRRGHKAAKHPINDVRSPHSRPHGGRPGSRPVAQHLAHGAQEGWRGSVHARTSRAPRAPPPPRRRASPPPPITRPTSSHRPRSPPDTTRARSHPLRFFAPTTRAAARHLGPPRRRDREPLLQEDGWFRRRHLLRRRRRRRPQRRRPPEPQARLHQVSAPLGEVVRGPRVGWTVTRCAHARVACLRRPMFVRAHHQQNF